MGELKVTSVPNCWDKFFIPYLVTLAIWIFWPSLAEVFHTFKDTAAETEVSKICSNLAILKPELTPRWKMSGIFLYLSTLRIDKVKMIFSSFVRVNNKIRNMT